MKNKNRKVRRYNRNLRKERCLNTVKLNFPPEEWIEGERDNGKVCMLIKRKNRRKQIQTRPAKAL